MQRPWPACTCRKTEVMNLLESAGFSRANPYYVVQQGKVCCLCSHVQSHFSWHMCLRAWRGAPGMQHTVMSHQSAVQIHMA